MKVRVLSILCAAVLQVLPLARIVYSTAHSVLPECSVIFRLVIGSLAALGAFDAVSGASTLITSPNNATGTVGQAFSYRIIVGPHIATIFKATPLPPGLYLERSFIRGTPTTPGVTRTKLTASDGQYSVSKYINIHINAAGPGFPPAFVAQPQDQDALPGEETAFHCAVSSEDPVAFGWYHDGQPISGATNRDLLFLNTPSVFVGNYFVVASNFFGASTSAVARLFHRVPIVESNAAWSYLDTGKNMRGAWRKPLFNDSAWLAGTAPLGYGWGDEATLVTAGPNPAKPAVTTYFRNKFVVADSNAYAGFKLEMQADDGAVVFLNGKELWRFNLQPKGNIAFRKPTVLARNAPADHDWSATNIYRPVVLTGTNVFAIEVHQAKTNGADMRFNFRFSGLTTGN